MQNFTAHDGAILGYAPPPPYRLRIGEAAAATSALSGHPTYPGQDGGIIFCGPGTGVKPALAAVAKYGSLMSTCRPLFAIKDPPTAQTLDPLYDQLLARGIHAVMVVDQEDDANHWRDPDGYKADYRTLREATDAHAVAAAGLILIAHKWAEFAEQHGNDWHNYYEDGVADLELLDSYSQTAYPAADAMFDTLMHIRDETGQPIGVGECGLVLQGKTDPTGRGRADAYCGYISFARLEQFESFMWWDGQGAADFRALDAPTHGAIYDSILAQ